MRSSRRSLHVSRLWVPLALLFVGLAPACQSQGGKAPQSEESAGSARSVCLACEASAGGETGDFPGGSSPCGAFLASVSVDEAEALRLGFDARELRRRLEQTIDLPLLWKAQTNRFGPPISEYEVAPPTGYEPETRLSARIVASEDYKYTRPDPEYCDGTVCRREIEGGGTFEVAEDGCKPALAIEVTLALETADGSVRGEVAGDAWHWPHDALAQDVLIRASANLAAVSGSLLISPNPQAGDAFGTLWLMASLPSQGVIRGSLIPEIRFGVEAGQQAKVYAPLLGKFPPPPTNMTGATGGTGAGPDAGVESDD
jgi:hypothetical protein